MLRALALLVSLFIGCSGAGIAASPVQVEVLAKGPLHPAGVAIDADSVYWVTHGEPTFPSESTLLRVGKHGGAVTMLARSPTALSSIAADDQFVYAAQYPGAVVRVARDGGPIEPFASSPGADLTVLDDASVYWMAPNYRGSTSVFKKAKGGGDTAEIVAGVGGPLSLATDGASLYYVQMEPAGVMKAPASGGAPEPLVEGGFPAALSVDSTHVFFTECTAPDCGTMRLSSVPKGGGAVTLLATDRGGEGNIAVAVDKVLWVGRVGPAPQDSFLDVVPKAGGERTSVNRTDVGPIAVAVEPDGSRIYWVDFDTGEVLAADLP